ncbi:MAG: hemerythrin domain-containing protein [Thermoanaerobaculia bacterium]|jgi:hypothetical protein
MPALHEFLSADHDRLDALLAAALRKEGEVDGESFAEFRRGLLRHISIEERVLFAALRSHRAETALSRQLHRDHAALSALLVLPPNAAIASQIAAILEIHNGLEEGSGGLYESVEMLAGDALDALMARAHAIPQVPVMPYADTPVVRNAIKTLLRDADEGRRRLLDEPAT